MKHLANKIHRHMEYRYPIEPKIILSKLWIYGYRCGLVEIINLSNLLKSSFVIRSYSKAF